MYWRWICCCVLCLLIHIVSVQSVRVEGVVGETVVLPCLNQKSKVVFWQNGDKTICDIDDGATVCSEDQDPAYKDRVTFKKGDFSISLKNVMKSDEGTYTCNDPSFNKQNVELIVKDRDGKQISPTSPASKNSNSARQADGLLTFLLACALLYILTY